MTFLYTCKKISLFLKLHQTCFSSAQRQWNLGNTLKATIRYLFHVLRITKCSPGKCTVEAASPFPLRTPNAHAVNETCEHQNVISSDRLPEFATAFALAGFMIEAQGSYGWTFYLAGGCLLLSGACMILPWHRSTRPWDLSKLEVDRDFHGFGATHDAKWADVKLGADVSDREFVFSECVGNFKWFAKERDVHTWKHRYRIKISN